MAGEDTFLVRRVATLLGTQLKDTEIAEETGLDLDLIRKIRRSRAGAATRKRVEEEWNRNMLLAEHRALRHHIPELRRLGLANARQREDLRLSQRAVNDLLQLAYKRLPEEVTEEEKKGLSLQLDIGKDELDRLLGVMQEAGRAIRVRSEERRAAGGRQEVTGRELLAAEEEVVEDGI